jgi:hypothetical protein
MQGSNLRPAAIIVETTCKADVITATPIDLNKRKISYLVLFDLERNSGENADTGMQLDRIYCLFEETSPMISVPD